MKRGYIPALPAYSDQSPTHRCKPAIYPLGGWRYSKRMISLIGTTSYVTRYTVPIVHALFSRLNRCSKSKARGAFRYTLSFNVLYDVVDPSSQVPDFLHYVSSSLVTNLPCLLFPCNPRLRQCPGPRPGHLHAPSAR